MFDKLPKEPVFSFQTSEKTKLIVLNKWLDEEIKLRGKRTAHHHSWPEMKQEGYEKGLTDAWLDVKIKVKELMGV